MRRTPKLEDGLTPEEQKMYRQLMMARSLHIIRDTEAHHFREKPKVSTPVTAILFVAMGYLLYCLADLLIG